MSLNWTIESTINLIAVFPALFSLFITLVYYLKEKDKTLFYFSLVWFFLSGWAFFGAMSFLLLSKLLFRIQLLFLVGMAYSVSMLVDSISMEHIEPFKLVLFTTIGTLLVVFTFNADSIVDDVFPNGELSLAMSGDLRIVTGILSLMIGLIMVYYMIRIHLVAPKGLKKYSLLSVIGALVLGVLAPVLIGTGVSTYIPGIGLLPVTLGALLMSIAFVLQPKLAYVLPFKAVQVQVIDIELGASLYTHVWDKKNFEEINELLFSGMISGISHFIDETLKKGYIRQVVVDEAVLLIENSYDNRRLAFVLVANNSSPSLKKALELFAKRFVTTYPIRHEIGMIDEKEFVKTSQIVEKCFPFVPKYE